MEELIKRLQYVRSLLTAMSNLNQREAEAWGRMQQIVQVQYVPLDKPVKKGMNVVIAAVLFVVASLLLLLMRALSIEGRVRSAYGKSIAFGDACARALPSALVGGAVVAVIAGAVVFAVQRSRSEAADRENALRMRQYQEALRRNEEAAAANKELETQIQEVQNRRQRISHEYVTSICPWFPREYCYFEAVDFFLHELELGTASTLPEAIKNYREFLFQKGVTERLDGLGRKMEVMIDNQKVMIDRQEEMIRQQMLGNAIAAANLIQNMKIAQNTGAIAANTGRIAGSNDAISAGIRQGNDTLGWIANRMSR